MKRMRKLLLPLCALLLLVFLVACGAGGDGGNPPEELTVTFDANGGSAVEAVTVNEGETLTAPSSTKEGYVVEGWYNGESKWSFATDKVTTNVTLTAKWVPATYDIVYDLGGGSLAAGADTGYTVESDSFTLSAPLKKGYTFLGWTYEGVTEPVMTVVIEQGSMGDKHFTAHWSLNTYDIDLELDGGTAGAVYPGSYTVESDTIVIAAPTKEGYQFMGWVNDSTSVPILALSIPKGSAGNISYTATWAVEAFTITYQLDGGAFSVPVFEKYTAFSETITLPSPTKAGYTFLGWTYEGVTEPVMTAVIEQGSRGDKTFTAHWSLDSYELELELNGGSVDRTYPDHYSVLDEIVIADPKKTGYIFKGWSTGEGDPIFDLVITKGSTGNKRYVATWEALEYKIEYDLDGGTFAEDFDWDSYTVEDTVVLPSPMKPGYDFLGWTTDGVTEPTKGLEIAGGSLGDKSFAAHWVLVNYTVDIVLGDGTYEGEIPTSYTIESDSFTLPRPTKRGYTFLGWIYEGVTEPVLDVVIEKGSTGDKRFTAKWAPVTYTITYQEMGDATHSNPATYTIESATFTLAAPTRAGFSFLGWTYEGVTEPVMTVVIEQGSMGELVFVAHWGTQSYAVTYQNTKGAENKNPSAYFAGSEITLQPLTASGYTFVGWYDANGNKVGAITADHASDLVLTARWSSTVAGTSGISYTLNADGTSYTASSYSGSASTVVIPSTYNGLPVTAIANNVFKNNRYMTTLIISDGITSIGNYAFQSCTKLTSITIGADVKSIGTYAFSGCTLVSAIHFNAVACNSLGYNNYAFYNVGASGTGITVTVGRDVTAIPGYLFCPYSSNASYAPRITSLVFESGSVCKSIGFWSFYNVSNLKSVSLPASLKEISGSAFYNCAGITDLVLPDSVETIGSYAFCQCTRLANITMPKLLVAIGSYAFYKCSALTSITIPVGVTSIENYAFSQCTALQTIYYNAKSCADFTSSSNRIFENCGNSVTGGITLTIGNQVERIPNYLFSPYTSTSYSPHIVTVIFAGGSVCASIGERAFYNNYRLTSITLPASVKSIGAYAFYGCSGLLTLSLGGVESISTYAFYNCSKLAKLELPATVKAVGANAFGGCGALTEVHTPSLDAWCGINFADQSATPVKSGVTLYIGGEVLGDLKIPEGVEAIGSYAFYGWGMESVTIPASVKTIGKYAFANCTKLAEIVMPGVTTIEDYAFSGASELQKAEMPAVQQIGNYAFHACQKLSTLALGSALESIGSNAFYNCAALTKLNLPATLQSVGNAAFSGCEALVGVYITNIDAWCRINFTSANANPLYYAKKLYVNDVLLTDLVVSDKVEAIGTYTFANYPELKSVTVSNGVTAIGAYAFRCCAALKTVTIGKDVESIGAQAFYECKLLEAIAIPDRVTAIGSQLFFGCEALKTVSFGASVKTIGSYAFSGCAMTEIVIPDSVTTIEERAFQNCYSLTAITLGKGVKNIGGYAFQYCKALTNIYYNAEMASNLTRNACPFYRAGKDGEGITVTVGKGVTVIPNYLFYSTGNDSDYAKITAVVFADDNALQSIGNYAFYYMKDLGEIQIPAGVTSIGEYTFYYCSAMKSVTLPDTLTTIGKECFSYCSTLDSVKMGNSLTTMGEKTFYYCKALQSVTLPATLTTIPAYAFANCEALESVTVNEGTTAIGQYAFQNCKLLAKIALPKGLLSIGAYSFTNCIALKSVTIPDSVTSIGTYVFQGCTLLETATFGTGETDIPSGTFKGCTALKNVTIPEGYTFIGSEAFSACTALEKMVLPTTLKTIYNKAFFGCTSLATVNIPTLVTSIEGYVFQGCTALKSIQITDSIKTIGSYAFEGCTGLTEVVIPDTVTAIGQYAFSGCTGLTSLTIGKGVTSISNYAFNNCTALETVRFGATSMSNLTSNNYVFSAAGTAGDGIVFTFLANVAKVSSYLLCPATNDTYAYAMKLKSVTFETGSACTSIGDYAFAYTTGLTTLEFPAGVTLGTRVFNYCRDLSSFKLTAGITSIPSYMFYGCQGLKSIDIPDTVTSIGSYAFYRCYALESITVGENITSIGSSAFYQCHGLRTIHFNAKALGNLSSNNSVFYEAGKNADGITVNIGAAVTQIPNYLFYPSSYSNDYAPKITSVVFAKDCICTTIGQYAFTGNSYLLTLTLPESIATIGTKAFYQCTRLIEIENRSGLTLTIGSTAYGYVAYYAKNVYTGEGSSKIINIDGILYFRDESSSTYQVIGCEDGVTELKFAADIDGNSYTIAPNAFKGRTGITKVVFTEGITAIGEYAFYGCTGIESITIPTTVTEISPYAFYGCSGLTELVLHDAVSAIGTYAFYGCSSLTSLTIPCAVSAIGNYAFAETLSLTELVINATGLPTSFSNGNSIFYHAGHGGDGITVTFDSEMTYIPGYLFAVYGTDSNAAKLVEVIFEAGSKCTTIGSFAFYYTYLEKITLPEALTAIGAGAFNYCRYLKEIVINATALADLTTNDTRYFAYAGSYGDGITVTVGKNVTRLPANLFYTTGSSNSPKITKVVFEDGAVITTIGSQAFYYCQTLAEIVLPASITTIGADAFYNCTLLARVSVPTLSDWLEIRFASIFANPAAYGTLYIGEEALNGKLVIPEGVSAIGDYAFYQQKGITELVLPATVTAIGNYAFQYCDGLTKVSIPAGDIGNSAFASCGSMTTLTIGEGVTFIDLSAFAYCTKLEQIYFHATSCLVGNSSGISSAFVLAGNATENGVTVTFGKGVTKIPAYLFSVRSTSDSPKFKEIIFASEGICTAIGSNAFYNCAGLGAITLPATVTEVGSSTFYNCTGLERVDLGGVAKLGYGVFSGCRSLTTVTAEHLTAIPSAAFENCTSLVTFVVPDSVTEIGGSAFAGCTSLVSITIGKGVTKLLGDSILNGCTALKDIYFNAENCDDISGSYPMIGCGSSEGLTLTVGKHVTRIPSYLFDVGTSNTASTLSRVVFEEGSVCRSIGVHAFSRLPSLAEVVLPEGLTSIGAYAFAYDSLLTTVSIPDTLTDVADKIFYECTSLSFTVYNGVNYLGNEKNPYVLAYAAVDATALSELALHADTKMIAPFAFYRCTALTKVELNPSLKVISERAFGGCTALAAVVIPDAVETIGSYAFSGCTGLTNVTLGKSLKTIYNSAFADCTLLQGVIIPDAVETVGSYAFSGCTALTSISIGKGVVTLGEGALYNCSALTTVYFNAAAMTNARSAHNFFFGTGINGDGITFTVGKDVTVIPNRLFYASTSPKITSVIFESGSVCATIEEYAFWMLASLTSITLPDSVKTIGYHAFAECTELKTVVMGNGVTEINGYAFADCTVLQSVQVSSTLTTLGSSVFRNCSALESIAIPSGVTEMPYGIFNGCSSLNSLTLPFVGSSITPGSSRYHNHLGYIFGSTEYTGSTCLYAHTGSSSYEYRFYVPTALKHVTVTGGVISEDSFRSCTMLTELTLEKDISAISSGAFSGCGNIVTVNYNIATLDSTEDIFSGLASAVTFYVGKDVKHLPAHIFETRAVAVAFDADCLLESIGDYAFAGSSITEIDLPDTVTRIGTGAFSGCKNLKEIVFPAGVTALEASMFTGCTALTAVELGNVTSIPAQCFNGCTVLASIKIPASVTEIGESAFLATALTEVTIPAGVSVIRATTFENCKQLASVTILGAITSIGERAFNGCTALSAISIGNAVTEIGSKAFYQCEKVTAITLPSTLATIGSEAFAYTSITAIRIPDQTTTVGVSAFAHTKLRSATLGNGITAIPARMFEGCSSLLSIVIPESATSIGASAFYQCTSLQSALLHDNILSIGTYAFYQCSELQSIDLPDNLTTLGTYAFSGCKLLTGKIVIPEGITAVDTEVFAETAITEVVIGNGVGSIGYRAFRGCTSLTKVTIGTGVDYISIRAFYGCSSLATAIFLDTADWHAGGTTYHFYISPSKFADTALMAQYLRDDKAEVDWVKSTPT